MLHPSLGTCELVGFSAATVNTESCDFAYSPTKRIGADLYNASFGIVCPSGDAIRITAATCALSINGGGSNEGLTNVQLANSGPGVEITPLVGGISYKVTNDGFFCPFDGKGDRTDGSYTAVSGLGAIPMSGGLGVAGT